MDGSGYCIQFFLEIFSADFVIHVLELSCDFGAHRGKILEPGEHLRVKLGAPADHAAIGCFGILAEVIELFLQPGDTLLEFGIPCCLFAKSGQVGRDGPGIVIGCGQLIGVLHDHAIFVVSIELLEARLGRLSCEGSGKQRV